MSHILVATGTKQEAGALRGVGRGTAFVIISGGGDAARLRAKLTAAAPGARGVLSFGMAGALVDGLAIGDWVVGERVSGAVEYRCDPDWSDTLAASLGARRGGVYADGRMIDTVAGKLALGASGALAVDMESHVAATVAAEHALPFAIARCISDGARHVLPPAITVAMRRDGGMDALAMLRSLAAHPGQLLDLVRTIAGFARAMRALKAGGGRIGGG